MWTNVFELYDKRHLIKYIFTVKAMPEQIAYKKMDMKKSTVGNNDIKSKRKWLGGSH